MKLVLYHFESCPYCRLVRNYIDEAGIRDKIEYRDTMESKTYLGELRAATGKSQVPCLMIDGKPLLESKDIVAWLKANVRK